MFPGNNRPSSGDRVRIRRSMRNSRWQTTEVGFLPATPYASSSSTPPTNHTNTSVSVTTAPDDQLLIDPLRSQSQPPSFQGEFSRSQQQLHLLQPQQHQQRRLLRSGESLALQLTESSSHMNHGAAVTARSPSVSPSTSLLRGSASSRSPRYRCASTSSSIATAGTTSSPASLSASINANASFSRSSAADTRGRRRSHSRQEDGEVEGDRSPRPPPQQQPESPVVFRLRQENLTVNAANFGSMESAPSAPAVNQDPESDHDLYPGEKSRLPFRSDDHLQRVFGSLNEMRRQGLLCDVVLKAGGGACAGEGASCGPEVEVPAHRAVLAASSPYFRAMFASEMAESSAPSVTIRGIDGTALALLVDFMYTSEVLITEETVQALLPAANLLQLTAVREACCEFLQCQLHPTNCLGIQRFADLHDCSELLQASRRFAEEHCGEVLEQGEEYLSLSEEQLVALISSDAIRVAGEEVVLEAALRWMRHAPAVRGRPEVAAAVCAHVRFGLLPRDYLVRLSRSEDFLRANPWAKDFLLEAMGFLLLPREHRQRLRTAERTRPRSVGIPKTLLLLGGQAPKAIRSVEVYDFGADVWRLTGSDGGAGISDLPTRRCRCGVAVVGGLIYVIGGFNGALRVRSVDIYDPVRRSWRAGPSLESRRSTLGVAVLDGVIYAVGGFNGTHGFASVEALDPWSGTWKPVAPMAVSRSSVGVVVLERRLYAVGGYDGSSRRCLASVEAFDPVANVWSPVADMNHRRSGPAVAECGGRIYAVGGHDGLLVHASAEYLDPRVGVWCSVAEMQCARRNAGLVAHNGLLYVVGGDDGSTNLDTMETYDRVLNTWTLLPGRLNVARCYAGIALVDCIAQPSTDS